MPYLKFEDLCNWKENMPRKRKAPGRLFLHKANNTEGGKHKSYVILLPGLLSQIRYETSELDDEILLGFHNKLDNKFMEKAIDYFKSEDLMALFAESSLNINYESAVYVPTDNLKVFNLSNYGMSIQFERVTNVPWQLANYRATYYKWPLDVTSSEQFVEVPKALFMHIKGAFGHERRTNADLVTLKFAVELPPDIPVQTSRKYSTINKCLIEFKPGLLKWLNNVSFHDFKDFITYIYILGAFTAYKQTKEYAQQETD
ncbi:MAG: hypothetical protein D6711_03335 [Chloroflexi bacterium]|nr:MAG: hypothetical protein D6711_03335 [Chloroflexota bacterium]